MISDAAVVDQMSSWADHIVDGRNRGPGDLNNAMRAAARETGVPYGFFWKLRYRRDQVKKAPATYFFRLMGAYAEFRRRQEVSAKAEATALADHFLKLAEAMRASDPDFHCADIDAALDAARFLGGSHRSVDRGED